ncbi:hypothetical protein DMP17_23065 [Pseudonocardia sp. TMWB2A]|uniref:hypothetical protein n=1 Tax=Pseudonocardia sp. TMWB2A TaxID=687430 RepID=UPI00307D2602
MLLDLALGGTASHVETVVRAVRRRCAPPRDVAARRGVSWHHDVDGSLVVRARLTPEDGALLVAAIEAGVAAARPAPADPTTPPGDDDTDDPAAREGDGRDGTGPIRTNRPAARRSRHRAPSSTPWPPGGPTPCWTWSSASRERPVARWWSGARRG